MPVIKSAIKKLRHDKKLEKENDIFRAKLDQTLKKARKTKSQKDISLAFSLLDKAAKKHLIHKNKAARLKASLTKTNKKTDSTPVKTAATPKKTAKKAPKPKAKTAKT